MKWLYPILFLNTLPSLITALIMPRKPRIELFFKTLPELRQRFTLLRDRGYSAYNLVNKNNDDKLIEWAQIIREMQPAADICVHYSLKYNKVKRGTPQQHEELLHSFLNECQDNVLIVSGSKAAAHWNTASIMDRVPQSVAVAYNPFLPGDELETEKTNLQRKLASNKVDKVYLQFGTDVAAVRQALQGPLAKTSVCASIFLPTKQLIAQQKFRPWNGVFLSDEFLSGPTAARAIVVELIRLYDAHEVDLLVEAPGIRSEKDVDLMENLLKEARSTQVVAPAVKRQKTEKPAIVLFGSHDLRLYDNQAVLQAMEHQSIVPLFVWEPEQPKWGARGAIQVVLKEALRELDATLRQSGQKLVCRNSNDPVSEVLLLAREVGSEKVYYNRDFTPEGKALMTKMEKRLRKADINMIACQSSLLYDVEKLELSTGFHGGHWGTLMPFLRLCQKTLGDPALHVPLNQVTQQLQNISMPSCQGVDVEGLQMAIMPPNTPWDVPIRLRFTQNYAHVQERLNQFLEKGLPRYEKERSRADIDLATSQLSVCLRLGTLSPHELYWKTEQSALSKEEKKTFGRRLIWRDLSYFQLAAFPLMRERGIRQHYDSTEWIAGKEEQRRLNAWKKGMTGYPIVDAGMRELYKTGWMTQSVRMVVASFLVEYLRVNWVHGAEWFHSTLADADSAINPMMWQNAGRSGIDQWNFILSPETASQDSSGAYTKSWVPELAKLPKKFLHRPWEAPTDTLAEAGVVLGRTYPSRVVEDLNLERSISVRHVLEMRRNAQQCNDDRGYDLISFASGDKTVVFTKKEYRIDRSGQVIKENASSSKRKSTQGKKTSRRRR